MYTLTPWEVQQARVGPLAPSSVVSVEFVVISPVDLNSTNCLFVSNVISLFVRPRDCLNRIF